MPQKWYKGIFKEIAQEAPATKKFFIEIPELEKFDFTPGQFITFDLPIHEVKNKRMRSYSIASHPNGTNVIELVIVLVEDGLGTPYLFKKNIGDEAALMGPLGKFVLPSTIERDICFICTGTGIAPFRSMLKDIYEKKKPVKNLYLIFGTRHIPDILYFEEMKALAEKMPNLQYIPVLSREQSPEWSGRKGYVHPVYEELFAHKPPVDFYLCGWTNMIDEAKQRIMAMGYDKSNIHVEIYG